MSEDILKNTRKIHQAKKELTQEQPAELVGVIRTTINKEERNVHYSEHLNKIN
jgi:DNA-binding XRE family transcriptional regulator